MGAEAGTSFWKRSSATLTERSCAEAREVLMKKYIVISGLLLLLVPFTSIAEDKRVKVPVGNSPSMGPENAPVTIVEFIDFQ
jgi:hypothetical protein